MFLQMTRRPYGISLLLCSVGRVIPSAKSSLLKVYTKVSPTFKTDKLKEGWETRHGLPQWSTSASVIDSCQPQESRVKDYSDHRGDLDSQATINLALSGFSPYSLTFPSPNLVFHSLVNTEIIFICATRKEFQHPLLQTASCPSLYVEKSILSPHWIFLALCWKSIDCKCESSFLNSHFCPIDPYVFSHAGTTLSWLLQPCGKVWDLEIWVCQLVCLFSFVFFKDNFGYSRSLKQTFFFPQSILKSPVKLKEYRIPIWPLHIRVQPPLSSKSQASAFVTVGEPTLTHLKCIVHIKVLLLVLDIEQIWELAYPSS